MKTKILLFQFILFINACIAQEIDVTNSYKPNIDIHSHASLKNFIDNGQTSKRVLDSIDLWQNYKPLNKADIVYGYESTFGNYFQANYTNIAKGNYAIVVNSFCELEKLNVNNGFKRFFAHREAKIPYAACKYFGSETTSPWREFIRDYKNTSNQQQYFYDQLAIIPMGKTFHLQHGTTSIIYSIEGGHTLHGSYYSSHKNLWKINVSEWKNEDRDSKKYKQYEIFRNEILTHADSLKKLDHPIFYMGIAHHDWNQLCGYAWSKDKEEDRTLIETAMHFGLIKHAKRKVSITSIGEEVIYKLLGYNPENHTLSGIPILIDVKHMNLQSRIRYYDMLCDIKNHTGKNIPIIISHVAASGLSLDRTFFNNNKSFSKSFTQDRSDSCMFPYKPKEDAGFGSFSDEKLISKNASKKNLPYVGWLYPWLLNLSDEEINRIFDSDGLIGIMIDQRPLGRSMVNYYSEAFCDVSEKSLRYDTLYNNGDQTKLNKELYDLIHTSRSTKKKEKRNYEDIIRKKLYIEDWSSYVGIKSKELSIKTFKNNENTELIPEFLEIEPFLRNIFYIVENSGISNSTAWNHICFGSDFDGWINPVDPVPLASDVNHLKMLIKIYLPHFVKQNSWTALNGNIYCDNPLDFKSNLRMHEKALLLLDSNIDKATDKFINKFFHDNALRVIEKYYGKNWNEIKND